VDAKASRTSGRYPDEDAPTTADAFRVQQEVVRLQVAVGDNVAGFKVGDIVKAMQAKFGGDEPDFVSNTSVGGRDVAVPDIIAATGFVLPALEVAGSRVRDWNIGSFDTLADSGSSAAVLCGSQRRKLSELNLADTQGRDHFRG
jgi:2-keto-4-pentenoate hydratase